MIPLVWSAAARRDLERLRAFIARSSPDAAERAAAAIARAATALSRQPELGRMLDDTPLRELVIPFGASAYVLHYRTDSDCVVVARVWHGREDRE